MQYFGAGVLRLTGQYSDLKERRGWKERFCGLILSGKDVQILLFVEGARQVVQEKRLTACTDAFYM